MQTAPVVTESTRYFEEFHRKTIFWKQFAFSSCGNTYTKIMLRRFVKNIVKVFYANQSFIDKIAICQDGC